ncbi:uncharacterized protein K441DRAFT_539099 [Cenococcum geophilum 1.58]|uniref:uncharacterized protein n=1 Tax=Cenococcum geophilum 1.58 TaxID=794803 RepID=UPI00358DF48E|nr:hypothetical protein K441DRAFT_539099 [Cenococcum geophilum 1.58]
MRDLKQSIKTNLSYLIKDPGHEHEKPYTVNYDTGGVIPRTNTKNESKPVVVQNFRDIQDARSFEEYGFGSVKIDSALASAEFNDEARVEEVYYPAAKKVLWEMFPDATRIETLDGLRKRHSQFPIATGETYEFYQPATLVHTDYTLESAERTARAAFELSPDQYRRIITLNFWKSFQGPGNDWPLALCDWRTIDRKSESITADVVFHNRFTENERIYYSPKHSGN